MLIKAERDVINAQNIAFIKATDISKDDGFVNLMAYFGSKEQAPFTIMFRGPERQAFQIIDQIIEKWNTDEVYNIPNARKLTFAEEKHIWTTYFYETDEMIIRENGDRVRVRIKSSEQDFNARYESEDRKELRQLLENKHDIQPEVVDEIINNLTNNVDIEENDPKDAYIEPEPEPEPEEVEEETGDEETNSEEE